jgi:hypothetical protein
MTTKTKPAKTPRPREYGPPDPGLFAALTVSQIDLVRQLITSGWYMHEAAQENDDAWWETGELLDDLHIAWDIAFEAESRAVA